MSQPLPPEPDSDKSPKGGFGSPIRKEKPPAPWSKPEGSSGIVTDNDGRMRTTNHKPHSGNSLEDAMWDWYQSYAG